MSVAVAGAEPRATVRALVATWATCIGLLALARAIGEVEPTGFLRSNLAGVAAILFVVLPERRMLPRGERWSGFGLPWAGLDGRGRARAWGRGAVQGLAVCAVVFPIFLALFRAWVALAPMLPGWIAAHVTPYGPSTAPGALRLPPHWPVFVVVQLFLVALPEELFYRGWMQTTWAATAPDRGVRVLGATLGAGFLRTQLLFALGHLLALQPWRIATFFPGLLFGWLRVRTGSLVAPIVVHALSNVFLAVLEASLQS